MYVTGANLPAIPQRSVILTPSNSESDGASISIGDLNPDTTASSFEWTIDTTTYIGSNLILSLDDTWGFYAIDESVIDISIEGVSDASELDLVLSFSIDADNYFSTLISMDNSQNNEISIKIIHCNQN